MTIKTNNVEAEVKYVNIKIGLKTFKIDEQSSVNGLTLILINEEGNLHVIPKGKNKVILL